jgi:S-(hydroxymethyl)glutathione dehydrogenase/alcohol dehydrogenase
MKAAVLTQLNKPLEILNIDIPELKKGQVLVKLFYSGLCHSQVMEVTGQRGEDKYLPHLLGHEGVGIVEAIGEGVTKVKPDDVVVLGWIRGEGLDADGAKYRCGDMIINSGGVTTFSEKTIAAENRLVILPPGLPLRLAMLLGCALPTGAGIIFNELQPEKNKTIAIIGLGGIGLSALMAAKYFSPSKLIAVDIEPHKLELALQLGATHTINSALEDPVAAIQNLTGGGVDYSVDAGGLTKTIEQAFNCVRERGGQCIFASHPEEGKMIQLEPHAFHRGKNIRGSWGGGSQPDKDIPKLVELYKNGDLALEKLISNCYDLEDINKAISDLKERKITRALINIDVLNDKAHLG